MTTRDNDPLDTTGPLDDNRLIDDNRLVDDNRPLDSGRVGDDGSLGDDRPVDADRTADAASAGSADRTSSETGLSADDPLVPGEAAVDFKARWDVIQVGFVDDPRTAVTDADKLVTDVLQRLSTTFDEQHRGLEGQWSNGEPSTEDLRSALQRYRAFFERLLAL